MKKLLMCFTMVAVFMLLASSLVSASPVADDYVYLIRNFRAGEPMNTALLPGDSEVVLKNSDQIKVKYHGLFLLWQSSDIMIFPDGLSTPVNYGEVVSALNDVYGAYDFESQGNYLWGTNSGAQYLGSYASASGEIAMHRN